MDIITIILTIAACIGGLFLLYIIIAAVALVIAKKQVKKFHDDFSHDHFRNF
jgi:hypothetical protein